MKNVLLVTSDYPPTIGAGAVRLMKFAKYLPEFGWNPLVLTVPPRAPAGDGRPGNDASSEVCIYRAAAPSLAPLWGLGRRLFPRRTIKQPSSNVADITEKEKAFLGRSQFLSSWFLVPDELITWLPFAVPLGLRVARQHRIDAIVSSSPAQSCHLVAGALSKLLRCAWVADFRDPWVTNPFFLYPTRLHRGLNLTLERMTVARAGRVAIVSQPLRDDLAARYPWLAGDKFRVITNGFDPDDFATAPRPFKPGAPVRIVHNGAFFYAGKDPFPFLQAIQSLGGEQGLKDVEIHFVGVPVDKFEPVIQRMGLGHIVRLTERLPYKKGLEHVLNADILLLISGPGRGVLTTKVFEYLAAFKPILALTPPGSSVAELLSHIAMAEVVEPDSPPAIAAGLMKLVEQVRAGQVPSPDREFVQQFSRRNQTHQLAECLDESQRGGHGPASE